jgi:hypothetical protein
MKSNHFDVQARLDSALQRPLSPQEFKPLKPNTGKGHTFNSLSDVVGVYGATAVSDSKKYQQVFHLILFLS